MEKRKYWLILKILSRYNMSHTLIRLTLYDNKL
mgnify:CR=1 FL=1